MVNEGVSNERGNRERAVGYERRTVYEINSPGRLAMSPIKTACFMETWASHPTTPILM